MPDPNNDFLNRITNTGKGINENAKNRWKNVYKEKSKEEEELEKQAAQEAIELSKKQIEQEEWEAEIRKKQEEEAIRVEEAKIAQEDAITPKTNLETLKLKQAQKTGNVVDFTQFRKDSEFIDKYENVGFIKLNKDLDEVTKKIDYFKNPSLAVDLEIKNVVTSPLASMSNFFEFYHHGKTEEEKKGYEEARKRVNEFLEKPVEEKVNTLSATNSLLEQEYSKKYNSLRDFLPSLLVKGGSYIDEALGIITPEEEKKRDRDKDNQIALQEAIILNNKKINELKTHQDNNGKDSSWSGFIDGAIGVEGQKANKLFDSGLGVKSMVSDYRAYAIMEKDRVAKENPNNPDLQLSREENIYLKSVAYANDINDMKLNQDNFSVKAGQTVITSAELGIQIFVSGGISAGSKLALKTGVLNQVAKVFTNKLAKNAVKEVVEEGAEQGAKALIKNTAVQGTREGAETLIKNTGREGTEALVRDASKKSIETLIDKTGEQIVKKGLFKKIGEGAFNENIANGVANVADVLTKPFLLPHTYSLFNQKMTEPIVLAKDVDGNEVILTSKKQKQDYEEKFRNQESVQLEKLQRLSIDKEGNKEEIEKIKKDLANKRNDLAKIYEPFTNKIPEDTKAYDAAFYAYTESVKEVASELFVGKAAGNLFKYVDRKYIGGALSDFTTNAGKAISNKVNKVLDSTLVTNLIKRGGNKILGFIDKHALRHSQFDEVFQSMPEEMVEELFVQAVPTYNAEKGEYLMSDYMKQLEEFRNPEFYALTAVSTGIMGGTMNSAKGIYGAAKYGLAGQEYKDNFNSEYETNKLAKSNLKDFYAKLNEKVTDPIQAEAIARGTGKTLYDSNESEGFVARMRLNGNIKSAKFLERQDFNSMLIHAVNTDTIDGYQSAMENVVKNKTTHPDTRANAMEMLTYVIPATRQIQEAHKDKINLHDILSLNNEININKFMLKSLNEVVPEATNKANELIKQGIAEGLLPKGYTLNDTQEDFKRKEYTKEEIGLIDMFNLANDDLLSTLKFNKNNINDVTKTILDLGKSYDYHTNPDNQKDIKKTLLTDNYNKSTNLTATELKGYKKAFNEIGVTEFDNSIDEKLSKEVTKQAVKKDNSEWVSNEDNKKETVNNLVKEEVDNKELTNELTDEDIQKQRDLIRNQHANNVTTEQVTNPVETPVTNPVTNPVETEQVVTTNKPKTNNPVTTNKTKEDIAEELKRTPEQEYNENPTLDKTPTPNKDSTPDIVSNKKVNKYGIGNLDADIFDGLTDSIKNFQEKFKEGNNATKEEKETAKKEVEKFDEFLKSKLNKKEGEELTLQEIVNYFIDTFGKENIKENFEGLLTTFLYADKNIFDADKVYTDTFGNNTEAMYSLFQKYQNKDSKANEQTPETIIETNNNLIEDVQKENEKVEVPIVVEIFDTNDTIEDLDTKTNNEEYGKDEIDLNNKTNNPEPKASHLGVKYETIKNPFEKDRLAYSEQSLNKSKDIDNNYISDPDYIKAGVELSVKINSFEEVKDMIVTYFDADLSGKETMSFNKWVERYAKNNGIKFEGLIAKIEASKDYNEYDWYWDKIPMIAKKEKNNIFLIHDVDWYNRNNVKGDDNVKQGKNYARKVRQRIFKDRNSNKESIIKIIKRKFGNLFNFKNFKGDTSPVALSEATTETTLYIAGENNTLSNKGDTRSVNLVGNPKLVNGLLYDVRKVNVNEKGEDEFIALSVITNNTREGEPINDTAYNNVKAAVLAVTYLKSYEKNPKLAEALENKDGFGMTKSKAELIVASIKKTTGVDILADTNGKNGLKDYLNMFVGTVNSASLQFQLNNKEQNENGQDKFPNDANYIESNGFILRIGLKGKVVGTGENKKVGEENIPFINFGSLKNKTADDKQINKILEFLQNNFEGDTGAFRKTRFMNSKSQLGQKERNFVVFDSNGNIQKNEKGYTYDDYIKDNVKSNIKSLSMQDVNGKTKSVTDIQPMVYYDFVDEPIIGNETGKTSDNVKTKENSIKYEASASPVDLTEKEAANLKEKEKENARLEELELNRADAADGVYNEDYSVEETFNDNLDSQEETLNQEKTKEQEFESTKDRVNNVVYNILSPELRQLIIDNGVIVDYLLNFKHEDIEGLYNSIKNLTYAQQNGLTHLGVQKVSVLSSSEQTKLVDSLFNLISVDLLKSEDNITEELLKKLILNSIANHFQPKIDELNKILELLEEETHKTSITFDQIKEINFLKEIFENSIKKLDTVNLEKNKIIEGIVKRFNKSLTANIEIEHLDNIVEDKEDKEEDNPIDNKATEGPAKNYSKSSLETSVKTSFSQNLRLLFSGIKKQYNNGDAVINFSGLPDHINADEIVSALLDITSRKNLDLNGLLETLKKMGHNPMFMQIHNAIMAAPEQTKTELMYKINVRKLDMYMLISTRDKYGNVKNLFKNISNAYANGLEAKWASEFRNSNIFKKVNGEYIKPKIYEVIKAIESLEKDNLALGKTEESIIAIQKVLKMVGITVQDNTLIYLLNELPAAQKAKGTVLGRNGILGLFKETLNKIYYNSEATNFDINGNSSNNPFKHAKTALALLIQIESYFAGTGVSKTFMSGDKSLQGVIQNNMAYQTLQNLKDKTSTYFKDLKAIPYSKNNSLLKLIEEDNDFGSRFNISFVPLNVMRTITNIVDENDVLQKTETKLSGDVNSIPGSDFSLAQISSFHNKMKDIKTQVGMFTFRQSNMYSHAIADKGQILQFATAVLDLSPSDFDTNKNDITANDNLLEYMLTQLFDSEFDRIISTHKNKTDINNYDDAAQYFLGLPIFNEISTNVEGVEVPIYDLLKEVAKSTDPASIELAREKYRPAAKALLSEFLSAKLKEKFDETNIDSEWIKFGFVTNNVLKSELDINNLSKEEKDNYDKIDINSNFRINKLDTEYVNKFKSEESNTVQVTKMLALDFIVNDLLHKSNLHQLFAGDLALYSKGTGKFKKKDVNTGRIVVDFIGLTKSIGDNLNKRFAMEIAPGPSLTNSKGDTYLQVMVQDSVSITSTAEALITQYYGSVSKTNKDLLNTLANIENKIQAIYALQANKTDEEIEKLLEEVFENKEKTMKALQKENKAIAGFFDIEGTDAQEYTTWKEHIDILLRKGDLSEKDSNTLRSAYEKLSKGEEINNEEIKVVMNPLKPMYGGHVTTKDVNDNPIVNRVVYIKSSSIPLLPQLTKGIKLDNIRVILENLQNTTGKNAGKNVRLSFQTANKIGAIDTKLTLEDLYNTPFERLYDKGNGKLAQSTLELNREGFRIQQDNPYKTGKNLKANKEDYITMGSQMWKSLMSGGISKETEDIFPNLFDDSLIEKINKELAKDNRKLITSKKGEMISGVELDIIKFEVEKMYYNEKRKELYRDLGLNQTDGKPFDHDKTIKKLHDLLKDECAKYPDDVIAGLKLVEWLGETTFMTPMWISSNSGKFETILQSLIYKRTMETKLPGYSHILASSEGFKKTEVKNIESISDAQKSGIVWLDENRQGDLLATKKNEDGTLAFSEILIQSKFRETKVDKDGNKTTKLIDLTVFPYSTIKNGVRVLNKEMIDEVLLNNFSYRIPTSGHQSGAMLKVVGFLPEAMGDVIVVPKEHTKQIGEDFDVDKRNVYKLNYEIKDKKIKVLEYNPNETNYKEKLRMLENAMINTYSSVFSSPSNKIQKMINKILSMEDAVNSTKMIDKRINDSKVKDRFFTVYSDSYQKDLLKGAIDGGLGTGVHSNAVTFQAQLERLPDGIQILKIIENSEGKQTKINSEMRIGTLVSDGKLGKIGTIGENGKDGKRNIVDVNAENQNSALDNIKAKIMALRNENKYTLNVLTQMTFRGFDSVFWVETVTDNNGISKQIVIENQVTSLFLSQPIIRRYVELMSEKESIFNEKKSINEIEKEVLKQLIKEYDFNNIAIEEKSFIEEMKEKEEEEKEKEEGKKEGKGKEKSFKFDTMNFIEYEEYEIQSNNMTGEALYDNLIDDPKVYNPNMQIAVLAKFFKLKAESSELSKYQNLVSVSGLGLSYFNVLDKIEILNKLANETKFQGVKDLIGKFVNKDSFEHDELLKNGELSDYTLIGNNWIKPTTTEGIVLINGIISAQHTMDIMFPYKNDIIQGILFEILGNKPDPTGKKRYKILNSFKDFLHSQPLGLFEGSVKDERKRLFFDTDTHLSLSNFLNQLKNDNHRIFIENDLLKSLKFNVKFDGTPSTIEHFSNNDVVLDGGNKYDAFAQLLSDSTTVLGIVNGVKMTPQMLAQELASYAYLSDNEAGITGFKKYITIDYLNYLGIADNIRLKTDIDYLSLNPENRIDIEIDFVRQYYQHNPETLKDFSKKNKREFKNINKAKGTDDYYNKNKTNKKFFDNLDSFEPVIIKPNTIPSNYIKIATTTPGNNGFYIYEFNGLSYIRIPPLGSANFVEYDMMTPYPTSLMNDKIKYNTTTDSNKEFDLRMRKHNEMNLDNIFQFKKEPKDTEKVKNLLDLTEGTYSLLKQIYTLSDNAKYQKFAEKLLPYIDTDIKVELLDLNDPNLEKRSKELNLKEGEGLDKITFGSYLESSKTIYLNQDMVARLYDLEQDKTKVYEGLENVLLEEIIHSITIKEINKYFTIDNNGNPIPIVTEKGTPFFATKLAKLYEIAKQALPYDKNKSLFENYYTSSFKEFVAGVFVSEEFRNQLDTIKIGNKTLLQMFRDALASMLQYITGSTYSDVTINSIYEMLQATKNEKITTDTKVKTNVRAARHLIEKLKGYNPEIDVEIGTNETLSDKIKNNKSEVPKSTPVKENNELTESVKDEQIYSQLGNRTVSNNVVIKSWSELKDATKAITPQGIVSTRIKNSNEHFGNPFSHDPAGKTQGLIKTETIKEAVEKYIDWVINSNDSRAEWIREQLKSGELKGNSILYYKELGEPSHATALDWLINSKDSPFNKSNISTENGFNNELTGSIKNKQIVNESDKIQNFNNSIKTGFLKDFNIDVQEYESIKDALGYNSTQMADMVSKFVALNKGEMLDKSVAYFAYNLLGRANNKIKSELRYRISAWDKYSVLFNKYKDELIREEGFIKNKIEWRNKIRNKIIVDYLAETLVEYYNNPTEFSKLVDKKWTKDDFSFFKKLHNLIIKLFEKIGLIPNNSKTILNNIGKNIAHEILNREYNIYDYKLEEGQLLKSYKKTIESDPFAKELVEFSQSNGLVLTGSLALRRSGSVYRTVNESLHDIDFVVPYGLNVNTSNKKVINNIIRYQGVDVDFASKMALSFVEDFDWYKKLKEKHPSLTPINGFYGGEHTNFESYTLTSVINGEFHNTDGSYEKNGKIVTYKKGDYKEGTGYIVDFFIRLAFNQEEHENYFKVWKEIMIAKLIMGRAKDFTDYKEFVPYIKSKDSFNFYYPNYVYATNDSSINESIKQSVNEFDNSIKTWIKSVMPNANVELVNDLIDGIGKGSYNTVTDLITLSQKYADKQTAKHEVGHAAWNRLSKEKQEELLNEGSKLFGIPRGESKVQVKYSKEQQNQINYTLKNVDLLQSDKGVQLFKTLEKNKVTGDTFWKKVQELGIPKEQIELLKQYNTTNREELITNILADYSYIIEINTAKTINPSEDEDDIENNDKLTEIYNKYYSGEITEEQAELEKSLLFGSEYRNTKHYSNLTVPGGTNYTEQEIATPAITPSIEGHAEFATNNGIGWFRSDDKLANLNELDNIEDIGQGTKTRRILEAQSDLFQKGRDKDDLVRLSQAEEDSLKNYNNELELIDNIKSIKKPKNQFLQLLNKDNNWVNFFVKSIIQDSVKKGYEKVLFPTGNTASKVEGHTTLEEFKKQKEDRIKELENDNSNIKVEKRDNKFYIVEPFIKEVSSIEDGNNQLKNYIDKNNNEIIQLKQELEKVETEGFAALRPIYNFYENTVTNILIKQFGKENVNQITDEYGNTWNEIDLSSSKVKAQTDNIKFQSSNLKYSGDLAIEEKIMEMMENTPDENLPKTILGKWVQSVRNFFRNLYKEKTNIQRFLRDVNQGKINNLPNNISNESNIKYQLPQNRELEEYVASEKTIRNLAARISDRIGIPVKFESDRTKEYKGKLENGVAYVNLAYATLDTPIHEILGHPIIRALKNQLKGRDYKVGTKATFHGYGESYRVTITKINNEDSVEVIDENGNKDTHSLYELSDTTNNELYQNLLKELEYGKGAEVLEKVKKDYTDKDLYKEEDKGTLENFNKSKYTLEEQQEEAIVELLGLMTAEKLDAVKDVKLISLLKRLLKEMTSFIRSLFNQKEVEIDKLPDNMTLNDIANLLAYSNSKLILPGNEVIYTTPDDMKFKTYQEASKHISDLVNSIEDVDLTNLNVKDILNNKKYELIDHLTKKIIGVYDSFKETFKEGERLYNEFGTLTKVFPTESSTLLQDFLYKNEEFEQSKEIIKEWKEVNNIKYNPEEVYSRNQEFISVVGAYSDFDVNLMMQNLLEHIEDNKKAGGEFAISAITKPIGKKIGHLEGKGGKIRFKIYPKSEDILWAANTDVFSGSVWDASEKINKNKKSELLGVSYTKYPLLKHLESVQPNLANIIDNLNHHHNELGITLTGDNFRLEYDEDIPYKTIKILNSINSILDEKYGKIFKPETSNNRITPIQTNKSLTKNIKDIYIEIMPKKYDISNIKDIPNSFQVLSISGKKEIISKDENNVWKAELENGNFLVYPEARVIKAYNKKNEEISNKEYTSQALINTKISALKEANKKYPRSLIRSEVETILYSKNFEPDFQKIDNTEKIAKLPEIKKCEF